MSKQLQQQGKPRPEVELAASLKDDKVQDWLRQVVPVTFAKYLTPERVTKIVIAACSRNPILLQCSKVSIIKSVAELVSLGIEPGGPLQQGYLVPRKNKGAWECMPIISYRGLISLLQRSGQFRSVVANVVHAKDYFEFDLASGERPKHRPCMDEDRGALIAVYCIADFSNGGTHMDFMTKADVDRIRAFSPAGNSDYGPWTKHYDEMARKTVVRRASKYWPMSSEEWSRAEAVDAREAGDTFDVLDIPAGLEDGGASDAPALPEPSVTDNLLSRLQQGAEMTEEEYAAAERRAPATGVA